MSIDTIKSLEPYKGIQKRSNGLDNVFADIKFNKKVPKYNYHSGLLAGMLVSDLIMLRPFVESKKPEDKDLMKLLLENLIPKAQSLANTYNWKLGDLSNLAQQFFGEPTQPKPEIAKPADTLGDAEVLVEGWGDDPKLANAARNLSK